MKREKRSEGILQSNNVQPQFTNNKNSNTKNLNTENLIVKNKNRKNKNRKNKIINKLKSKYLAKFKLTKKHKKLLKKYIHRIRKILIVKISLQRVGIALFCGILLFSGYQTVVPNLEAIKDKTLKEMKQTYNETGSFEEVLKKGIVTIESSVSDKVYGKESYINIYGLSEKMLGKHYLKDVEVEQSVIKDNNGKLQFVVPYIDTSSQVEQIVNTYEVLKDKDIPMVYIQTPTKVIEEYTKMPPIVDDYTHRNTIFFKKELEAHNIPFLDLTLAINNSGIDYDNLFYNTDHHWTTRAAFWAVEEAVDYIERNTNLILDENDFYTNIDNYDSRIFENSFLGSQGRRTGKYYGGVDDYELLYPKFETDYKVTINKASIESVSEGSFTEAIVKKHLLAGDDIFTNRYAAYLGGDFSEVIIENNKIYNDIKVLIVKDSFALPFSAFLSTMVEETRLLDTRYYTGMVEDYIDEYNPDLVLYVYKSINTQK